MSQSGRRQGSRGAVPLASMAVRNRGVERRTNGRNGGGDQREHTTSARQPHRHRSQGMRSLATNAPGEPQAAGRLEVTLIRTRQGWTPFAAPPADACRTCVRTQVRTWPRTLSALRRSPLPGVSNVADSPVTRHRSDLLLQRLRVPFRETRSRSFQRLVNLPRATLDSTEAQLLRCGHEKCRRTVPSLS